MTGIVGVASAVALTVVLCGVLVESVIRLPLARGLARAGRTANRATRVMRAPSISDHWKERAMLAYAGVLFRTSLGLAGLIALVAGVAGVLIWLGDLMRPGYAAFVLGPTGLLLSVAIAALYAMLRRAMGRRHALR